MDDGDGLEGVSSMEGDDGVVIGLSELSCNFLLLNPPLSCFSVRPSPNIQLFSLLTSDNFTGFTMKSSAPSSKHLIFITASHERKFCLSYF